MNLIAYLLQVRVRSLASGRFRPAEALSLHGRRTRGRQIDMAAIFSPSFSSPPPNHSMKPSMRGGLVLDHPASLHDEAHFLRLDDVLQGIARDRHEIGELAFLEGADLVGEAEEVGAAGGGRDQRLC